MIQQGDTVGLFFEYGPEKCCYLGLAEYIGKETPPDHLADYLAEYGRFDGSHAKLGRGIQIYFDKGDEQMAFRLLESEEVVYEQEAWYAPQAKIQRLLDNTKLIHGVELNDIRKECQEKREKDKELPLVASGFVEVHLSFSNLPLRDPSALPDDLSPERDLCDRIRLALNSLQFADDEIDFKVREFEEFRRSPDRKRKDSEKSGSIGICPRWKEG